MKNSKIAIAALMALAMFSYSKAEEIKVDFDGKSIKSGTPEFQNSFSFENSPSAIITEEIKVSTSALSINTDLSIVNIIDYPENRKADQMIMNNLKNLLIYGTKEEKLQFLAPGKYVFPEKFKEFKKQIPMDLILLNKNINCHQINCHDEKTCTIRESCNNFTRILCAVSAGALMSKIPQCAWIIGAIYSVGEEFCADIGEKICKNVEECAIIHKCDTVCDSDNNPCHTTSTGIVQCQ